MTGIAIGSTIGNYEILSELGRGGMGVVYKAHEQSLQRVVALKVLPADLAANEAFVKRFLREARAAAQLNHPNIVITHAVGESKGHHYIAMEYVKGSSLIDLIREQGQMEVRNALKIIGQASQALLEAHRQNIIHRDIKPHNIMIDLMGRARVMDFGLAHVGQDASKITQTGALLGTPTYMSPEQCRGDTLGPESDIFSLGITLYEMLAGRVPFHGDSPLSVMHQIVNEPVRPITEYNSTVPESVIILLNRMLDRNRSTRYQDMMELATDIKKILKNGTLDSPSGETGTTLYVRTQNERELRSKPPEASSSPAPGSNVGDNLLGDLGLDKTPANISPRKAPNRKFTVNKRLPLIAAILILIIAGIIALKNNLSPKHEWVNLLDGPTLSRWDNPETPGDLSEWHVKDAGRTSKAYVIFPGITNYIRLQEAVRYARSSVGIDDFGNDLTKGFRPVNRGMGEYRLGNYDEAATWLESTIDFDNPRVQCLARTTLAMTEYRLGHKSRARILLSDARVILSSLNAKEKGDGWMDILISETIYEEADALIN